MTAPLRLGCDLGKFHDPTALAAVETVGDIFEIRQLGRVQLGTPYPRVAEIIVHATARMRDIRAKRDVKEARHDPLHAPEIIDPSHYNVAVYVDATGLGNPVVDMIAGPLRAIPTATLIPVELAAGDEKREVIKVSGWRYSRVGKAYLVGRLQALLQTNRVRGQAENPEFIALQRELQDFHVQAKVTHDTYGAKSGAHDDLVIALALACLDEPARETGELRKINDTLLATNLDPEPNAASGQSLMGWKWG